MLGLLALLTILALPAPALADAWETARAQRIDPIMQRLGMVP